MSPETIFQISGPVALSGWLALACRPLAPRVADLLGGLLVPAALSLAYAGLIAAYWAGAEGGFGSLVEVQALFAQAPIAMAGWLHYLAFDLFLGAWILRDAARRGVPHLAVLPLLPVTLMFGPLGFLAWLGLRTALAARQRALTCPI